MIIHVLGSFGAALSSQSPYKAPALLPPNVGYGYSAPFASTRSAGCEQPVDDGLTPSRGIRCQ
jgi:hypothetical protein